MYRRAGIHGEVGRGFVRRGDVPFPNSTALDDPLVACFQGFLEVVVGDDLLRHVEPPTPLYGRIDRSSLRFLSRLVD